MTFDHQRQKSSTQRLVLCPTQREEMQSVQLINSLGSSGSDAPSVLSLPLTANEDWVSYRRMKTKNVSMTSFTKMTYTGNLKMRSLLL